MKHLLSMLTLCTWSLWFGGGIALLMFVSLLFHYDRSIAVVAAPQMFLLFERYQLILATIVLACAFAWHLHARSSASTALLALIVITMAIAVVSSTWITPAINELRINGRSATPAFRQLHGISVVAYLLELSALLCAGTLFPALLSYRTNSLPKGAV